MVLRDEAVLGQSLPHDKLRLHAVGADGGHAEVFLLAVKGIAVAVHVEGKRAAEDGVPVPAHALQKAGQLPVVAAEGDIEHVVARHETEGVGGVRPSARPCGEQKQRHQRGQNPFSQVCHIVIV